VPGSGGLYRRFGRWLVLVAALALSAATFASVDSRSHSASDTLYGWAGYALLIWLAAGLALVGIEGWSRSSRG
jgi:hypothetical protein